MSDKTKPSQAASNSPFDTVVETPFDTIEASDVALSHSAAPMEAGLASEAASGANANPQAGTQNNLGSKPTAIYTIVIIGLLIISLAFIVYQNQRRDTDVNRPDEANTTELSNTESGNTAPKNGPFTQAQTANQRRGAQDVLANILTQQKILETKKVTLWAETAYLEAQGTAQQGDILYRRGQFSEAQVQYQASLDQLTVIAASLAPLINQALANGLDSINTAIKPDADTDTSAQALSEARASFEWLLSIDEENEAAQIALRRSEKLPQVLALMTKADKHFAQQDYQAALSAYRQAVELDPLVDRATRGLEQTQNSIKNQQLQQALNQGFNDLGQSNYPGAIRAFKQALGIEPNSEVATEALLQAKTEFNQIQIKQLLVVAANHEQQELWHAALESYNKVLAIDNSVVAASIGKLRSQTRANLDTDLQRSITDPLRLASASVYQQARQRLADAKGIRSSGARLNRQIIQLEQTLALAITPQPITLASDNATQVTILRVARLGQFSARTIELKPGKYIAEGVRQGYRDVRISFIVEAKNTPSPIQIICRETI